jgi:hypothetical protein
MRRGLDAVSAFKAGRRITLLPSALVYNNWSRREFMDQVELLAGPHSAPLWRTHQVAAWVSERDHLLPLRFGFPMREPRSEGKQGCARVTDLMASYILRALGPNGIPAYRLTPSAAEYERTGTAARVIHGLYALQIAGKLRRNREWTGAAQRGVAYCLRHSDNGTIALPDHVGGALADVILLGAASACGLTADKHCRELAHRVVGLLHDSGWIGQGPKRLDCAQDQDFLPGATIWAIASYCRETGLALPEQVKAARRFYGYRLREHPTWGCSWLAQGWAAVHDLTGCEDDAELVFAAVDWMEERQLQKSGAFLEELSPDEPSFNTGFAAEGVAAGWRTALTRGKSELASRYQECWLKAMHFVRTLLLEEDDVFPFRLPAKAVGGVRCTVSRSDIRIDQVSHSLHALVDGELNLSNRTQTDASLLLSA